MAICSRALMRLPWLLLLLVVGGCASGETVRVYGKAIPWCDTVSEGMEHCVMLTTRDWACDSRPAGFCLP